MFGTAIAQLQALVNEFPDDGASQGRLAQSHRSLGAFLWNANRRQEALLHFGEVKRAYEKAVKLSPKFERYTRALAEFLATCLDRQHREPQRAVELANRAIELAPGYWTSWNVLGVAHYSAGHWKEAIGALEESMQVRPSGDSHDWFFLAMAYWQLGDKEQARKWSDKAIEWMDKNLSGKPELIRYRAEAAELLGVDTTSTKGGQQAAQPKQTDSREQN